MKSDRIKSTERSGNDGAVDRGIGRHGAIDIDADDLFHLALEARQTAPIGDRIIDVDPAPAGAKIHDHEIRPQQRIEALVELDRPVVTVEPARENFGQQGSHYKILPKYLHAQPSSIEGVIRNPAQSRRTGQPAGTRDTIIVSVTRHASVRKKLPQ